MDKELALFIRSFRGELSTQDKADLAALLENGGAAKKYEQLQKIWDTAIAEGKAAVPDSDKTWKVLFSEIRTSERRRRRKRIFISAASVSGIAAVLAIFFTFNLISEDSSGEDRLSDAATVEWEIPSSDKIIFRTSSGKYYSVDSRQAEISSMADGSISINSVCLENKVARGYNSIRVPRGKMANLNLPDGTRICLNSLASITFPSKFQDTRRMVYLSGEAYFSVAKDEQKPFTVLSDNMDVSVLGTEFNFEASGRDAAVTLVSGKVLVKTDMEDSCVLLPNQQVSAENGKLGDVVPVDVETVVCWTSHKIICRDSNLSDIFKRLSLYFDRDFICDEPLDDIFISGKLDLTKSLDNVLKTLAFIAPVNFSKEGKAVVVTRKE